MEFSWKCEEIFSILNSTGEHRKHSVLLLNQKILNERLLLRLWNSACIRGAVDGGGNRLYSIIKSNALEEVAPPTFISGDLDSIRDDVLEYFKAGSTPPEVCLTEDQDETDFTKAVRVIKGKLNDEAPLVFAFCEVSGRLDQVMANIETLFHAQAILPPSKSWLVLASSTSISWLLPGGSHKISCDHGQSIRLAYCSLIPIGSESVVTTTGLRWNLDNNTLAFGQIVSTSNEIVDEKLVTVVNSQPLLFTIEFELKED